MRQSFRKWKWEVIIGDGRKDEVTLTLGFLGREKLAVNGLIISNKFSYKLTNTLKFALSNGQEATINIAADPSHFFMPRCELRTEKAQVKLLQGVAGEGGSVASLQSLPKWSWIFYGLLIAIPAVSMGGALPFLICVGGASLVSKIMKNKASSTATKVFLCLAVVVVAWACVLSLVLGIAYYKRKNSIFAN